MKWKALTDLLTGHKTYLQTHNFPDPDALASAYGLQQFLKKHGVETQLCYDGSLDTLSAKRMVTEFDIEIYPASECRDMKEEDYIVTVDGQKYNANFTDLIGDEVACIDHHPTFIQCDYKFSDIRIVGACSSIVAYYYYESGTDMDADVATALLYGLRMDTSSMSRGVTELDIEMFGYLYKQADNNQIMKLWVNTMELGDLKAYGAAIENIHIVEGIGFVHIPFSCNDALIAMISEFILSLNEVSGSVIYADRNGGYKFSVRSMLDDVHAGMLVSNALEGIGNGGGHAAMAGGILFPDSREQLHDKINIEEVIEQRFLEVLHKGCGTVR